MNDRIPYFIAVLGMAGGVFIAILFGVNESYFEHKISAGLAANATYSAISDPIKREAKLSKEAEKSWRYYQRYHFHATGIAAMSLGVLLLLNFINTNSPLKRAAAYLVSVGGFFYPFVWLFAAIYGPEMGRSAAKEKFALFGYMGGVFLLGLLAVLFLVSRDGVKRVSA